MKKGILKLENIGLRRIHLKKQSAIILIAALSILALLSPVVIATSREYFLEQELRYHFCNWESDEYTNWNCADKSDAVEKYLESKQYRVIDVYGHTYDNQNHRWLIIEINGVWKEFECNTFKFQETSVNYDMLAGTCTLPMEEAPDV